MIVEKWFLKKQKLKTVLKTTNNDSLQQLVAQKEKAL